MVARDRFPKLLQCPVCSRMRSHVVMDNAPTPHLDNSCLMSPLFGAARGGEFAQMTQLLETAIQNGLADTTLCAQSAELLSRICCLEGRSA
jgi:hypothetical protein